MDGQKLNTKKFPVQKELDKSDVLIILGDFGLLFDDPRNKEEQYWLNWLESRNYTICFLRGNHDNPLLLNELFVVQKFESNVGIISDSIYYLKNGEIYTINGKTFFIMGGAFSTDIKLRKEGKTWWKEEMPSEEDYEKGIVELDRVNNKVDYILSHTCSLSEFDEFAYKHNLNHGSIQEHKLRNYLENIILTTKHKQHLFAHFHKDYISIDKSFRVLYDCVIELEE